jgi:trk system potassium uptake protein TrkA
LEGDGTDLTLIAQLDLRKTDLFVAVTGRDDDNLVACQLVRATYSVEKVLARLNDPRNHTTFDALQIPVVSVTDLLAQVISQELEFAELVRVAILVRGELSVFQVDVPADVAPTAVSSLVLPDDSVLVAVDRNDDVFVPNGNFIIRGGDRVTAVSRLDLEDDIKAALSTRVEPDTGPAFEREA